MSRNVQTVKRANALTWWVLGCLACPWLAQAEEDILWKVESRFQPQAVPFYNGQPSPFPMVQQPVVEDPSDTISLEMEMAEKRQQAVKKAEDMIQAPSALEPYLERLGVGGSIDGAHGRKVLVGNSWLGVGDKLSVPVQIAPSVKSELAVLQDIDATESARLWQELRQRLQKSPSTELKVLEIRPKELVLENKGKKIVVPVTAQ